MGNRVQEGWEVKKVESSSSQIIPRGKKVWRVRRMDLALKINQALGRTLVFVISFNLHNEISFTTPILQMRKWRLREVRFITL